MVSWMKRFREEPMLRARLPFPTRPNDYYLRARSGLSFPTDSPRRLVDVSAADLHLAAATTGPASITKPARPGLFAQRMRYKSEIAPSLILDTKTPRVNTRGVSAVLCEWGNLAKQR